MNGRRYSNLIRRIGFVLIAIALAFVLASVLSQDNINSSIQYSPPGSYYIQEQNFSVVCCNPSFVSPKLDVYLGFNPQNASITVYLMKTNASEFDNWMSANGNVSLFGEFGTTGSSLSFLSYLSSHQGELLKEYNVSQGAYVQTNFFPTDVEPLMIVMLNPGKTNTSVSATVNPIGITVPPSLGIGYAAAFLVIGAILSGTSYLIPRKKLF